MVKIYTSKTCAPCKTLKTVLNNQKVEYTEHPVEIFGWDEVLKLTGRQMVPVMVTEKGHMQGLSFKRIKELLT